MGDKEYEKDPFEELISRRSLITKAGAAGGVLAAAPLIAACGSSSSKSSGGGAVSNSPEAKELRDLLAISNADAQKLSGKTLKEMGYAKVYNLGAFKDWVESGGAVDKTETPGM